MDSAYGTIDVATLALRTIDDVAPAQRLVVRSMLAAYSDDFGEFARMAIAKRSEEVGFGIGGVDPVATAVLAVGSDIQCRLDVATSQTLFVRMPITLGPRWLARPAP